MDSHYIPQPFAIYNRLEYQTHRRAHCENITDDFRLVTIWRSTSGLLRIPPFQIRRNAGGSDTVTIKAHKLNPVEQVTITVSSSVEANGTAYKNLVVPGQWISAPTALSTGEGQFWEHCQEYYLEIVWGGTSYYSEVFRTLTPHTDFNYPDQSQGAWLSLEYSNSGCIIGELIHNDSSGFQAFLPVTVGQPEYDFTRDVETGGQGQETALFQSLKKRWKFFLLAPEFMADALAALQLFSAASLNLPNGDFYIMKDVSVEVDWSSACVAKITVTFTTDIIPKSACCPS